MSEKVGIAELVEHEIGGGWGEETPSASSSDAAFVIRGTDIPRAITGDVSSVPYRFHKSSNLRSRTLRHNDVVFEVSGGSKGQPVGRALLVDQRLLDQFSAPAICASFCKLIRFDPLRCNPRYVFRVLQAAYGSGELDAYQVQSTGITNFRWKPFLEQFTVELPDIRRQGLVAGILDSIDELVENNRRRVEVLEEMAQAIYREWFVHFRYPGHENVPLVDSPLGPIPDGWTIAQLQSVAEVNRRSRTPTEDEVIRYLDISALGERTVGCLSELTGSEAPGRARRVVEPGDIVWSMVRPNRRAHALLVDPGPEWVASTGLAVLSATSVSSAWLFETTSTRDFSDYLVSQEGGAAYPAVKPKDFQRAPVIVPPATVDQLFADRVTPMHRLCWSLREQSDALASLRDLLLPKLVTGQIDVSELDLDALTGVAVA